MEDYVKLKLEKPLAGQQITMWNMLVSKFINTPVVDNSVETVDDGTIYISHLEDQPNVDDVELIVKIFTEICENDFAIEASVDGYYEDDEVEIDNDVLEYAEKLANQQLHARWIDTQILEGWRYGLRFNKSEKTDPRLRDWHSLHESYRTRISMTPKQALAFIENNYSI